MYFNENESELIELIDLFVNGKMPAPVFERRFMDAWRKYRDSTEIKNKKLQKYMDSIFTAVDVYCSDPKLRDDDDFNDEELLDEVVKINKNMND